LYQLYTEPEIVKWIRSARLRWAGHIVRKRESDPARKSTFDLLLGERTVERPKRSGLKKWRRPRPKLGYRYKESIRNKYKFLQNNMSASCPTSYVIK
jgi:hypothetical protein